MSVLIKNGRIVTAVDDYHADIFVSDQSVDLIGRDLAIEADTVIDNISSLITENRWARNYDGKVFCFVETGMDSGTYVWFNYQTPPNPGAPSQMIHWFKLAYNRLYWLSARGLL